MLCITFLHLKMNLNCVVHEHAKQSLLHAWWFEEAVVILSGVTLSEEPGNG